MKIIGVIPARYQSTRFAGKVLADICGKPMIWWVFQQAVKVKEFDDVYVATDDERIKEACDKYDMNVIMTSTEHKTGTDRIGEAAKKLKADLYVNIQGDEPLLEAQTIQQAILPFFEDPNLEITNLMTKITNPVEVVNVTVPKVITNKEGIGVFLTRSAVPFPKGKIDYTFFKQVCVYGFKPEALSFFCSTPRGKVESIEDIEILRFIEHGHKVKFIEVESDTTAVDTPKDLEKVIEVMEQRVKQ
ncbi:3-deoxy-manno-octulosonate cytidylyltransferase [Anaerosacchariphilus polymeriproducens]|uniref:3-deoxy-manno-octulosonate cytidylyltransferase n=1 Tax=Anaerosacchariphilus polymeriproducens TaxID=1812858 RepID=A0A371AR39_9FIRM|nr:3-deoxy-manno-octulosonate cytidylyltransferase [Anaerosacchariphilus polymeriproducens]RDU22004.1 3-deoxy-manno-octulosonate cytidylyltransferase [Anaerosacchariphilus polymeriproducens]